MKKLNLKITGHPHLDTYFLVDGKSVKGKKNKFGNISKFVETDKNEVEIAIFNFDEMQGKLWFLTSFVFFIVSIFGLLDVRANKKCRLIDCKLKVKLDKEENDLNITYNQFENNGCAIHFESDSAVEVISNRYYINEDVKKRVKIMKWVKIVTVIVAIIILILVLM